MRISGTEPSSVVLHFDPGPRHPMRHVMQVKFEQPIDELKVQVMLLHV